MPIFKAILIRKPTMQDKDAKFHKGAITLLELNIEELRILLQFPYSGASPEKKMEKHLYSL